MTKFYLAAWLGYSCPLFSGWMPEPLKPILCKPQIEYLRTSYRSEAEAAVRDKAPGSALLFLEMRGGRTKERKIRWLAEVQP